MLIAAARLSSSDLCNLIEKPISKLIDNLTGQKILRQVTIYFGEKKKIEARLSGPQFDLTQLELRRDEP